MDARNPATWTEENVKGWKPYGWIIFNATYQGDGASELARLRSCAARVLATFPSYRTELEILDDGTMVLRLLDDEGEIGDVFACYEDGHDLSTHRFGMFLNTDTPLETEIYVRTNEEVINVLGHYARGEDLSQFERVDEQ